MAEGEPKEGLVLGSAGLLKNYGIFSACSLFPFPPKFMEKNREGNEAALFCSFFFDPSVGFCLYRRKHSYTMLTTDGLCSHQSFKDSRVIGLEFAFHCRTSNLSPVKS